MKKIKLTITFLLCLLFLSSIFLFGDNRVEPIDLVIGLDKSLSMDTYFDAVKQWVINVVIKENLIVNDYFLIIEFYQKAEVAAAGYINTEADKEALIKKVEEIKADGRYTDIGNALDRLRDELLERLNNGRKKIFLFITDGKNEPPRTSQYFTKDGKVRHEYMQKLETLLDKINWKVSIIGIGDNFELTGMVDQFKADFHKLNENGKDNNFETIGSMDVNKDLVKPIKVGNDGRGKLNLSIKTQRFTKPQFIQISSIKLTTSEFAVENILEKPFEMTLPQNGETLLTIPVALNKKIKQGDYSTTLNFTFKSEEHFADTLDTSLHVSSFIESVPLPLLIIVIIVIAAILILLIVFIIIKIIQGNPLRFRLVVDEMPLPRGRDTFKVMGGRNLFLIESMDLVRITERLSGRCIAKLYVRGSDLKIAVLKEASFPELKKIPDSIMGHTLIVNTENGRKYHVKFEEV
jgi:hypothetical protein